MYETYLCQNVLAGGGGCHTCATNPCHSRCRSREWAPDARTSRRTHLAISTSESTRPAASTNSRRGKGTGREHRGALTKAVGEHQLLKTADICKLHTHRTLMVSAASTCPCAWRLVPTMLFSAKKKRFCKVRSTPLKWGLRTRPWRLSPEGRRGRTPGPRTMLPYGSAVQIAWWSTKVASLLAVGLRKTTQTIVTAV